MKKILLFVTAAFLVTGVTFADGGKKCKKKCSKECKKTCAEKKSCHKDAKKAEEKKD